MEKILLHAFSALAYLALALHFWNSRWRMVKSGGDTSTAARMRLNGREQAITLAVVALHAYVLFGDMLGDSQFRFGFAHALSVMALLALVFYGIESIFYPLEGMLALVLPPAALCTFMPALFEGAVMTGKAAAPAFVAHVVIAMGAYAFIAIAAAHAILMALVERRLSEDIARKNLSLPANRSPRRWCRARP